MKRLFAWFKRLGRASPHPARRSMTPAAWPEPSITSGSYMPTQVDTTSQQDIVPQIYTSTDSWQQPDCDTSFQSSASSFDSSTSSGCDSSSYTNP